MKSFCLVLLLCFRVLSAQVELGVDVYFKEGHYKELSGKRVGLVTNQTGVDGALHSTIDLFLNLGPDVKLAALFAPEHGLTGLSYAFEEIKDKKRLRGFPSIVCMEKRAVRRSKC